MQPPSPRIYTNFPQKVEREKEAGRCGAATESRRGGSGKPGRAGFETLFPKGMIIRAGPGL